MGWAVRASGLTPPSRSWGARRLQLRIAIASRLLLQPPLPHNRHPLLCHVLARPLRAHHRRQRGQSAAAPRLRCVAVGRSPDLRVGRLTVNVPETCAHVERRWGLSPRLRPGLSPLSSPPPPTCNARLSFREKGNFPSSAQMAEEIQLLTCGVFGTDAASAAAAPVQPCSHDTPMIKAGRSGNASYATDTRTGSRRAERMFLLAML